MLYIHIVIIMLRKVFLWSCFVLGIFVGIVNTRSKIVGGSVVTDRSKFKYQALVKFDDNDYSYCGGIIISSDLVLSAAHCFDLPYNEVKVIVGNLKANGDDNAVVHYVKNVLIHENYDKATVSNDIAVLKLSTHLYFNNNNVGKISWNNQEVAVGTTCVVSGWGVYDLPGFASSDDLRAVDVKIVDTKTCDLKYDGAVMEGMLCAGEPGKDACMNDSGGPLVCDGVLVGIVSWGPNNCGDADFPGVYTNVSYFSTWIADVRSSGNSPYLGFITVVLLICLMLIAGGLKLTNMSAPLVADMRGDMDLDCRFDMGTEQLYAVKWYKDDQEFFRYMPEMIPDTMSYPVAGVHLVQKGTDCGPDHCKVRLRGLTRDHSGGAYRCEISSEAPTFRLASETHNVTIAALPRESPRIEGLNGPYTEGDVIRTNCVSDLADPAPILSWYVNNQEVHPKHVGEMTSSEPDNRGLMARTLTLNYPVDRKHSQADSIELRCVATLPGIPQPPQSTSKLVGTRTIQPQVINNQKLHWYSDSARMPRDSALLLLGFLLLQAR